MSRCEKCGAKDHSTLGHEAALGAAAVFREQQAALEGHAFGEPAYMRQSWEVEALLPFEVAKGGDGAVLIAQPQKPFMPRGLMLWDVGLLNVSAALVGRDLQLVCSFGNVPARWFNVQKSFDAIVLAQTVGDAAAWGYWTPCHPGQQIHLRFDGPASRVQALMWGLTP